MASIIIRPATIDDLGAVGVLWEQLVDYHLQIDQRLPPAIPGGGKRYARRLIDKVSDIDSRLLVAESDGQVIGFALGMVIDMMSDLFMSEPGGFLADIYVHPGHRRDGVGRRLVENLRAWFYSRGVTYFEWHVASQNVEGLAFWQAVGGQSLMVRMRASTSEES